MVFDKETLRPTYQMVIGEAGENCAFYIADSVMIMPENKIGIVCEPVNEKGMLRVQLRDKKIWINHKRVKLHVAAAEIYR